MAFKEFAFDYMEQLQHALDHLNLDQVKEAVDLISSCRGTVWLIGNGGSAALASHMATDLQLAGVRAMAMTDMVAITTYANDCSFTAAFTCQMARLFQPGDVLIAISGSGNSGNIMRAVEDCRDWGGMSVGITGFDGGQVGRGCDIHINVPAQHMGVSQDGHQVALHLVSYFLMERKKVQ